MNYTDHKVSDHFPDVKKMAIHLMNYTDNQLKAALAKMLPDKLKLVPYGREDNLILSWILQKSSEPVRDTELLHLCWLVEEEVFCGKSFEYLDALDKVTFFNDFMRTHATWQNRVIALAKVKGIEI
jgi:hypothetical protein